MPPTVAALSVTVVVYIICLTYFQTRKLFLGFQQRNEEKRGSAGVKSRVWLDKGEGRKLFRAFLVNFREFQKNLMTSKKIKQTSKKSCDITPGCTPNIKMKLKSKVIRIIVYSKICILTQTHDDGKDLKRQNEVKVAGLVVGWYQRCSVDLFLFRSAREKLKVEGKWVNHVCARLSRVNTAAAI